LKPRVLHLLDSFRQGGSESQALKLACAMKDRGRFEVDLACLDRSGPLLTKIPAEVRPQVPEFKLDSFYDLNMLRQTMKFAKLLKDRNIQIVHTHDFYTNIFGIAGAALAGVPVRVASRREASKRAAPKRMAERLAYRQSSAVIANCEQVRSELIAEGVDPRKLVTVYNGVEIGELRSEARTEPPGKPGRELTVCIVANLRPVKDHATLLRAAKRVLQQYPETQFVLAGEGPLEDGLRLMAAELGIYQAVHFIGRCEAVPALLEQSSVCVLSSKSEGFPNAVLEYMAAGKPVVSTRVGGVNEALTEGDNGFLVDPGDDVQLSARITWLLRNRDNALEMGQRGRAIAIEKFAARVQLDRVESLYSRLLTGLPAVPEGLQRHTIEA
jgi:glycosyltransferase involved in cell wall biosynthesis